MPQKTKNTPMMEQYLTIKSQYEDCLLFYRLGDFYELFFDDALKAAQLLEITLTSRNKNADEPIPMCGVPHHAAKDYIRTLIEKGYKVAICEQVEDAKVTKGMVKREVVQVVTPGTFTDFTGAQLEQNNYLVGLVQSKTAVEYALTYVDISTGELKGTILHSHDEIQTELSRLQNREVVFEQHELVTDLQAMLDYFQLVVSMHDSHTTHMSDQEIEPLLVSIEPPLLKQAFTVLLNYLAVTQKRTFSHLQQAQMYETEFALAMNFETKRNLELTSTIRFQQKHGSLFWFLDETKTAMGTRMLKQWIEKPLVIQTQIEARHARVENLMTHFFERADLVEALKQVYDLERIVGKVSFGTANARDLLQLNQSLGQVPRLKEIIASIDEIGATRVWDDVVVALDDVPALRQLIDRAINEDAPLALSDGNLIKAGYHQRLDQYRDVMANGRQWLAELQQKERELTGIKTLKISYNRVFGYYIEVTKANVASLDDSRYERKQTLANAERYVTPELKEKERLILEAEEKATQLEYELFVEVREAVKHYTLALQTLARAIAQLDVIQSFSYVSEKHQLIKPELSLTDRTLAIVDGRHPVVEKVMGRSTYVPNSVMMSQDEQILLITGPNMSGKSTYMRQVALCVILAQMGCFVPAKEAKMPIFTKIFTRIGAADDLIAGQSTFMVEMLETNTALQAADEYSLLLFDEIGRGTATYDGMALAEAILAYIHENIPAKTFFSTHYHELTDLSKQLAHLRNVHVGAREHNGEVVFLHKIMAGPADKSYGIHVAKLAGLPESLLKNAQAVLYRLETAHPTRKKEVDAAQLSLFEVEPTLQPNEQTVLEQLNSLTIETMTPIEAMMAIHEWQNLLKGRD